MYVLVSRKTEFQALLNGKGQMKSTPVISSGALNSGVWSSPAGLVLEPLLLAGVTKTDMNRNPVTIAAGTIS